MMDAGKSAAPLNVKNYLNLLGYIINCFFVQAIGAFGLFNLPDNSELSAKYQTIITPAGWAFAIWGPIFILQAIVVVVQMFPRFRGHPLIQEGVSYWYFATCLMQVGWTLAFAFEKIWLSMVFMAAILVTLFGIAYQQYYQFNNHENPKKIWDFWLLILPFSLHFGWIICASCLNVNLVVVKLEQSASVQLCVGIICLAVLHAVALWALYFPHRPNYTVPCVIAWANGAIASELVTPSSKITATFGDTITEAVRMAAASVCIIVLILIGVRLALSLYRKFFEGTRGDGVDHEYEIDAESGVDLDE